MLSQQEALLWNAKTTTGRLEPLYKQNAISKRDLDNAIASQLSSEAQVQSAKANVVTAELNLGYTTIRSPVTGLAGRSRFREGALITIGADSSKLTTVSVYDPIWVYFSVSDLDLLHAKEEEAKKQLQLPKNMDFTVELVLADGSVYPEKGKVDFTAPILNQNTGTMEVRAVFANPGADIKPGQFVKVRVSGAIRPNVIVVPQTAVMQGKSGMFVYIVGSDNKAKLTQIDAGEWFGTYWIITEGLMPGDQVVISGINKIQPGSDLIVTQKTTFVMPTTSQQYSPTQDYGM
jgi:membrane fusion protein (multidrug efflux system)